MRIILLDCSGSMGRPFTGTEEYSGRTRGAQATLKLEAAKIELIRSVASFADATSIAIFEFTSSASLIYEGTSNDHVGIEQALTDLVAHNGTNIASALDKVSEYVSKLERLPIVQILVISDGLSDLRQAQASAQKIAMQQAVIIDVILIDSTEEGLQVARSIVINGQVIVITSSEELEESVLVVSDKQKEFARQLDMALSEYQEDENSVIAKTIPVERLSFTAAYPGAMSTGAWYSILVYLHLANLRDQVLDIIRQRSAQLGLRPLTSSAEATTLLKRGNWLRFIPRLGGATFNPLSQEVAWLEDLQELSFRLMVDQSMLGRSLIGSIDVYCETVLIAQIPLSVNIREETDRFSPPVTCHAQTFSRIFASYAHADSDVVEACSAVYTALGIYMYIDKHSLRSGQLWHPMLRQFIDKADLFQLFWSKTSSTTTGVEDEWRYALSQVGRKGEMFIRPMYWENELPPPPKELSHIHFAKLDLEPLGLQTSQINSASQEQQTSITGTVPPIPVTVVPALSGILPETQKTIQQDIAHAVSFLEETTKLRYYPVPTLLVDEHIVKSVRSFYSVDSTLSPEKVDRFIAFSDFARSIELTFHVWGRQPSSKNYDDWENLFGKGNLLAEEQFDYIRRVCEGMIQSVVRSSIQPEWLEAQNKLSANSNLPQFTSEQNYSEFILTCVDYVITTTKSESRRFHNGVSLNFYEKGDVLKKIVSLLSESGLSVPLAKEDSFSYSIRESFSNLLMTLQFFRMKLQTILTNYNDPIQFFSPSPLPQHEEHIAIASIVGKICQELTPYDTPGHETGGWLIEVITPSWRNMRNELIGLGFHNVHYKTKFSDFITLVLNTVHNLLQEGLNNIGAIRIKNGFSIKEPSWDVVQREIADLKLHPTLEKSFSRDNEILLEGDFSEFVRAYGKSKNYLLDVLSQPKLSHTPVEQIFNVKSSTYGIYASDRSLRTDEQLKIWAFERGIPTELTFPKNHRVLFCLTALSEFENNLKQYFLEYSKAQQMARDFQRSILIHEHWHAILETGLDHKRAAAIGTRFEEAWQSALPLNESLAVWMELHYARQKPDLTKIIWNYIRSGTYPQWPYNGAERIEALYQREGIEAIRKLIQSLRVDPESAQVAFDMGA
jgi:hypothetical protein